MAFADHLFEGGLRIGAAGWHTQPAYVENRLGLHAGGQLYYHWISSEVVGLRVGLNIDCHNTALGKRDYEDGYSTLDVDDQQLDIAYSIGSLQERYRIWSIGVPLQVSFTYRNFSLLAGPKAVFPLSASWQQSIENAALTVYFPDYDNLVEDSYALAASPDFSYRQDGRFTLPKVQWWGAVELCYAIPLNTWARNYRSYLTVGVYADYCFTRFTPEQSEAECLIRLTDTRDGFPLQRLYTSVLEGNRQGQKLVTDIRPFDVGITVSYAISPFDPHSAAKHSCHCLGK